jgi:hypothetical protein
LSGFSTEDLMIILRDTFFLINYFLKYLFWRHLNIFRVELNPNKCKSDGLIVVSLKHRKEQVRIKYP